MTNPFFSIVIATYNRAVLISDTIRSVLSQNFLDFELIIVDDGSKDHTAQVIESWKIKDSRIQYIYQENAERGAARNHGFRLSKGSYVLFFDSDDEMKNDHLETLHKAITENPQYELFSTKFAFKDKDRISASHVMTYKEGVYGLDFALKGNPLGTLFCLKKNADNLFLFPEDRELAIMEDWMCLLYNLKNKALYLIDKITVYVNNHDARSMAQNQLVIRRRLKATAIIIEKVNLTEKERKTLWAFSYYFCGVHAYLDFNRGQALSFARKAINTLGPRKEFMSLYLKSIAGKQIIEQIKKLRK